MEYVVVFIVVQKTKTSFSLVFLLFSAVYF